MNVKWGVTVVLLAAVLGCSRNRVADYSAKPADARAALETGLKAWKEGHPVGLVPGAEKPQVQVGDSDWQAGHKLLEYEILGDEPPAAGETARPFKVRLKTDRGQREVKYMVLGIDPVLVFRDDDFAKLSGAGK